MSEQFSKKQKINTNFYIVMACLVCVGIFISIIYDSRDKDTVIGAIGLTFFFFIFFVTARFIDKFLSGYKKIHTLIYTLYNDRILYETNINNEVIFVNGIKSVRLLFNKSLTLYEICFYLTNGSITCVYSDQKDFHEYFKNYLNEHSIYNNL